MTDTTTHTAQSSAHQHLFIILVFAVCSLPLILLTAMFVSWSITVPLEPEIDIASETASPPPAGWPYRSPDRRESPRVHAGGGIVAGPDPPEQSLPEIVAPPGPLEQSLPEAEISEPVKTPDECLDLGIINRDGCLDYVSIYERLKEAPLAYNRPDTMVFEKAVELSLVIDHSDDADPAGVLGDLEGSIVEGTTRVTLRMSAQLQGSAFTLEPEGLQRKLVTPVAPTRWTWSVTPREFGSDKLLTLKVYVHMQDGDDVLEPLQIRTYTDRIFVDVMTWDYVRTIVTDVAPVYAFAVALFGTLSGIAAWAWRQSRRRTEQGAVAEGGKGDASGTNRAASEEPESGSRLS